MPRNYRPKLKDLPTKYSPGFIGRMDGRTELVQRMQGAFNAILDDLGGEDDLGYLKVSLVERCVFLENQLRLWEVAMLQGKTDDAAIGRWIQAVNAFTGIAKTLGLTPQTSRRAFDRLYDVAPSDPTNAPVKAPSTPVGATPRAARVKLPPKPKRPRKAPKTAAPDMEDEDERD